MIQLPSYDEVVESFLDKQKQEELLPDPIYNDLDLLGNRAIQENDYDETSISDDMIAQQIKADDFNLDKLIDEIESRCIRIALEMNDNNVSKAAKALKINRTTLYSRVQKLGTD